MIKLAYSLKSVLIGGVIGVWTGESYCEVDESVAVMFLFMGAEVLGGDLLRDGVGDVPVRDTRGFMLGYSEDWPFCLCIEGEGSLFLSELGYLGGVSFSFLGDLRIMVDTDDLWFCGKWGLYSDSGSLMGLPDRDGDVIFCSGDADKVLPENFMGAFFTITGTWFNVKLSGYTLVMSFLFYLYQKEKCGVFGMFISKGEVYKFVKDYIGIGDNLLRVAAGLIRHSASSRDEIFAFLGKWLDVKL